MFHVKHFSRIMSLFAIGVRFLNAGIMVFAPLLAAIVWVKWKRVGWRVFGIGVLTFIASQLMHVPFNAFFLSSFLNWEVFNRFGEGSRLLVVSLAFGLSASFF